MPYIRAVVLKLGLTSESLGRLIKPEDLSGTPQLILPVQRPQLENHYGNVLAYWVFSFSFTQDSHPDSLTNQKIIQKIPAY